MLKIGSKNIQAMYYQGKLVQHLEVDKKILVQSQDANISNAATLNNLFSNSGMSFSGSSLRIGQSGNMSSYNPTTKLYISSTSRDTGTWYNNMMMFEINIRPIDSSLPYGFKIRLKNTFVNSVSSLSEYTVTDYNSGQTHSASGNPSKVGSKGCGYVSFNYDINTNIYSLRVSTTGSGDHISIDVKTPYFVPMYAEIKGLSEVSNKTYNNVSYRYLTGYQVKQ